MADRIYEFGSEWAQTYTSRCSGCGKDINVSTQKDESPEYYAEVHVRCPCGGSVVFDLPVN